MMKLFVAWTLRCAHIGLKFIIDETEYRHSSATGHRSEN